MVRMTSAYRIEDACKELSAEARGEIRQRDAIPLFTRRDAGESASSIPTGSVRLTPTRGLSDDQGMLELPEDLESKLAYRIAYGEAARLAEMARFDHGWGKDFAAGIGGDAKDIEQEVKRRVGPGIHPKLIKMAVEDALDQRKPRW